METQENSASAGGGVSSVLASENRDFLITPSGDRVSVNKTGGKTIGLYFGANWYSKCESFTPVLASAYRFLWDNGSEFEVVFVSSDEDQPSFDRFHSTMPWPAIPFGDLPSKRGLTQMFQIEAIPSLIILDSDGNLVRTDGVQLVDRYGWRAFPFTAERVAELEGEERAMRASQTLAGLLTVDGRNYVMSHGGQVRIPPLDKLLAVDAGRLTGAGELQVPVSSLVGKTVGLYFSAHRSPPCAKFTSRLVPIYDGLRGRDAGFEIVLVSLDRDEDGYSRCYDGMPWLALPHSPEFSRTLSRYLDVEGIPSLVIIGPDGKTVTREGRNLINLHLEMAFPFTEAQSRLLKRRMDEDARGYPSSFHHSGHRHVLHLVSENSGGGPFICCACDEQGLGWAYQCLACGYEVHLKCARGVEGGNAPVCAVSNGGG